MSAAIIEVESVSKRFGRTLALDDIDISISPGELFALVGPNGAGKSTLVDILCTVSQPDSGAVRLAGVDALRRPVEARERLGVVFQSGTLDGRLTTNENLDFHARVYGMDGASRRQRRAEVLDLVGLPDIGELVVRILSQGMRRRLEIARAIMHEPAILLLDEPTVGLDPHSRAALWQHLEDIRRQSGVTVVVTTHYLEEVDHSSTVCIIDQGKVLASGTPAALKREHGSVLVTIKPVDEQAAAQLRASYPDAAVMATGEILLSVDESAGEQVLADVAALSRQTSLEQSSLESVFLRLTGRSLRDESSGSAARRTTGGMR